MQKKKAKRNTVLIYLAADQPAAILPQPHFHQISLTIINFISNFTDILLHFQNSMTIPLEDSNR